MNKVRKTITLSATTVKAILTLAKQDSRSFSQMVEILVEKQLSEECTPNKQEKNL